MADDDTSSYHSANGDDSVSTTSSASALLHFVAIVEHTVASLPCALNNSVTTEEALDYSRRPSTKETKTRTVEGTKKEQNSHFDHDDDGDTPIRDVTARKKTNAKIKRVHTPPLSALETEEDDDDDEQLQMNTGDTLSSLDTATICQLLEPIRKALEDIDAESFMSLQRVDGSGMVQNNGGGACLRPGVKVHPIHADITPKRKDLENKQGSSIVRYLHVTELENQYSVGIFVFPPNAVIPLHDHPGMSVLSRVLYGDLIVKSYDILPEEDKNDHNCDRQYSSMSLGDASISAGEAENCGYNSTNEAEDEGSGGNSSNRLIRGSSWLSSLFRPIARTMSGVSSVSSFYSSSNKGSIKSKKNATSSSAAPLLLTEGSKKAIQKPIRHLSAPGLSMLFPHEGNAHEFVAGEHGAAVLDVLLPPYCCDHDRNCTFYKAVDENGDDFVGGDSVAVAANSVKNRTKGKEEDNDDQTMASYQSTTAEEEKCWLKPVPAPNSFHCISGQYADLGCVNE